MSDVWMIVIIQIVVTWWAVDSIKSYILKIITALAEGSDNAFHKTIEEIRRRN